MKQNETQANSQDIIDSMIMMAGILIEHGDYERAVETYKNVLELQQNETAQYNFGTLYAQGK